MKSLKIISLSIFLLAMMVSCDKIEGPYTESGSGTVVPTDTVVKKVLLEEFTGHRCPNCPSAATIAHQLETLYPDRFTIVAIHSGNFAITIPPNFSTNYTCTEGDEINAHFSIDQYPSGIINRKDFNGSKILGSSDWGSKIAELLSQEPDADININKTFDESSKALTLNVKVDFFTDFSNDIKICAYLTESGMVSHQLNSNSEVGTTPEIAEYTHNHVLRASMNSTWGSTLAEGGVSSGSSVQDTISYTISNTSWNVNNMNVVVFIYDATTEEIIQCEEISVK